MTPKPRRFHLHSHWSEADQGPRAGHFCSMTSPTSKDHSIGPLRKSKSRSVAPCCNIKLSRYNNFGHLPECLEGLRCLTCPTAQKGRNSLGGGFIAVLILQRKHLRLKEGKPLSSPGSHRCAEAELGFQVRSVDIELSHSQRHLGAINSPSVIPPPDFHIGCPRLSFPPHSEERLLFDILDVTLYRGILDLLFFCPVSVRSLREATKANTCKVLLCIQFPPRGSSTPLAIHL